MATLLALGAAISVQPASAQTACSASNGATLATCIETYNIAGSGEAHVINLTTNITLFAALPPINNEQSPPATLTIEGGGRTIQNSVSFGGDVLHLDHGDLTLREVTIAGTGSDGLEVGGGTATIERSLFRGGNYGVFFASAEASTISDSTIFGAGTMGVGVGASAEVLILRSTILNSGTNAVQVFAGGVANIEGSLLGDGCQGTVQDQDGNVADSDTCFGPSTSVPDLGDAGFLANNGCNLPCTRTVEIFPSSPAARVTRCVLTDFVDQRGFPRQDACDAGAYQIQECGVFDVGSGQEAVLAEAIDCYNERDDILTTNVLVRLLDDVELTTEPPVINASPRAFLTIDGQGHTINAEQLGGDALVVDQGSVFLTEMTIMGAGGAGVNASAFDTGLRDVTLIGNGIGVKTTGFNTTRLSRVTIALNGVGVELERFSELFINDVTIVHNESYGVDANGGGLDFATIEGSLIASNNDSGEQCNIFATETMQDLGGNAVSRSGCTRDGRSLVQDLDGTFAAVPAANGCTEPCTHTVALNPDSPAIDTNRGCEATTDQRGVDRTPGRCDAGAFEVADCPGEFGVTTPAEFSFGIHCYNVAQVDETITVNLMSDMELPPLTYLRPIDNPVTDNPVPKLVIDGQGHALSGDNTLIAQRRGPDTTITRITLNAGRSSTAAELAGTVTISRSTIAGSDRGVYSIGSTTIEDSTFTGNTTGAFLDTNRRAEFNRVTMIDNHTSLTVDDGFATITGSLLAGSTMNCALFPSDSLTDGGGNIIDDETCFGAGSATAVPPTTYGALADNGCTTPCTQTIALLTGSPAIDAGPACTGVTDQRGVARTDGACDAGAFEADRFDADNDGFEGPLGNNTDCNDDDPSINPDAIEVPNDGVDQDCDNEDLVVLCNGLPVTINLNDAVPLAPTAGDDVILGTPGDDVIESLGGNDVVCGEDGNDLIVGGAGDDTIIGGDGDDRMFGDDGRDIIRGNSGNDVIFGGDGNDRLLGGIDDDELNGEAGDDFLGGFGGSDTINGGAGDETIFGGFGADTIDGGAGNDTISGLIGNDTIRGGNGNDILNGDRGNDVISGGPGDDVINGGNANDVLDGGTGNDSVNGGRADDQLSGGADNDTCVGNKEINGDIADATCERIFGVP